MMRIKVVPYTFFKGAGNRRASIHGACPPWPYQIVTEGFTWQVIGWDGSVTYGLCRVPVATYNEAFEIARRVPGAVVEAQD
jgi:hypothetical protein